MIVTNDRSNSNQDDISFVIGNDDEVKSVNGLNREDEEETNDENEYKSYKLNKCIATDKATIA